MEPVSYVVCSRDIPTFVARALWVHRDRRMLTVRDRAPGATGCRHLTYGTAARQVAAAAQYLRDKVFTTHSLPCVGTGASAWLGGVTGGGGRAMAPRVGILAPNRAEWVLADLSIAAAGGCPIGLHVAWPADELAHAMSLSGVETVVVDRRHVHHLAAVAHALHSRGQEGTDAAEAAHSPRHGAALRHVIVLDTSPDGGEGDEGDLPPSSLFPPLRHLAHGHDGSGQVTVHAWSHLVRSGPDHGFTTACVDESAGMGRGVAIPAAPAPPPGAAGAGGAIAEGAWPCFAAEVLAELGTWATGMGNLPPSDVAECIPLPPQPATAPPLASEDDMFTLVFTSGTSGKPKGVVTSRRRWLRDAASAGVWAGAGEEEVMMCHNTLAHGADRGLCWQALAKGARVCLAQGTSHEGVMEDAARFAPTILLGLSHFWARLFHDWWAALRASAQQAAWQVVVSHLPADGSGGDGDATATAGMKACVACPEWDDVVMRVAKRTGAWDEHTDLVRNQLGGRLFWACTGGGVTAPAVKRWLQEVVFGGQERVKDSYGATEFPGISTNGEIAPDVDMQLVEVEASGMGGGGGGGVRTVTPGVERGEVWVRSTQHGIMGPYLHNPDATAEAFVGGDTDVAGMMEALGRAPSSTPAAQVVFPPAAFTAFGSPWYRTGDLGDVDESDCVQVMQDPRQRGRLSVLDRAKHLTELYAEGRSVWVNGDALAQRIASECPAVHQCFVFGDRNEGAVVAVVVPDAGWLSTNFPHLSRVDACALPPAIHAVLGLVRATVAADPHHRPYEVPCGVVLEPVAWTEAGGWLTSTGKQRRAALATRYRVAADAIYAAVGRHAADSAPAGASKEVADAGRLAMVATAVAAAAVTLREEDDRPTWVPQPPSTGADVDLAADGPGSFAFHHPDATIAAQLNRHLATMRSCVAVIRHRAPTWTAELQQAQDWGESETNRVGAAGAAEVMAAMDAAIVTGAAAAAAGAPPEALGAWAASVDNVRLASVRSRCALLRVRAAVASWLAPGRTMEEAAVKSRYEVALRACEALAARSHVRVPYMMWAHGWWRVPRRSGAGEVAEEEVPPALRQSLGDAKVYDAVTGVCLERDVRDVGSPRYTYLDAAGASQSVPVFQRLEQLWHLARTIAAHHAATGADHPARALASLLAVDPFKREPARWVLETAHPFHLRDSIDLPLARGSDGTWQPVDTPASALSRAFTAFANRPALGMPDPAIIHASPMFPSLAGWDGETVPLPFGPRGSAVPRAWHFPLAAATPGVSMPADCVRFDGYRWLKLSSVAKAAVHVGRILRSLPGVCRGDMVALAGYNTTDWAIIDFGCALAGLRAMGVHTTNPLPTTVAVLKLARARVLVATSDLWLPAQADVEGAPWSVVTLMGMRGDVPDLGHVLVMDAHLPPHVSARVQAHVPPSSGASIAFGSLPVLMMSADAAALPALEAATQQPPPDGASSNASRDSMFTLLFTSGSTGNGPKAVIVTAAAFHGDIGGERLWYQPLVTSSYIPLSHSSDRYRVWQWVINGGRVGFVYYDATHWRQHEMAKKDDMVRTAVVTPVAVLPPTAAVESDGSGRTEDAAPAMPHVAHVNGEPSWTLPLSTPDPRHLGVETLYAQVRHLRPTAMSCPPNIWTALFNVYVDRVNHHWRSWAQRRTCAVVAADPRTPAAAAAARAAARVEVGALLGDRMAFLVTGGSPTPAIIRAFAAGLRPAAQFADSYGTTETGACLREGVPVRVGAGKTPVEVMLAPVPSLHLAGGDVGEVHIRSPLQSPGYVGKSAPMTTVDGWYATGDLARRVTPARYRLLGRVAAAAIIGSTGMVVFLTAAEAVWETCPSVRQAFLYCRPATPAGAAGDGDDCLCAVVIPSGSVEDGVDEGRVRSELVAALTREGMSLDHVPAVITLLPPATVWSIAGGQLNGEGKKNRAILAAAYGTARC